MGVSQAGVSPQGHLGCPGPTVLDQEVGPPGPTVHTVFTFAKIHLLGALSPPQGNCKGCRG